ncbi:MAG: hypothetical protein LBE95_01025 [Holosporaceae bacterium]|jgi:hypothetical protein|nr:hypothetical protein [Holosporaceae bacterium]
MNRLKVMVTGAALAAASGGAWGAQITPELDFSGIIYWGTPLIKLCPNFGVGKLPLDAAIATGQNHTFSRENEIIAAIVLKESTPTRMAITEGLPAVYRGNTNSWHANIRKERGLFNKTKLVLDDKIQEGDDIQAALVVQPFPSNTGGEIYPRPEFAFFPSPAIGQRNVVMQFGYKISGSNAVFTPDLTVPLNNTGFCNPAPGELKVTLQWDAQTQAASFVSFFKIDKRVVVTYHILVSSAIATRMKEQIRFAAMSKFGDYWGCFQNIYKTNGGETAALAANLQQLKADITRNSGDDPQQLNINTLWKQITDNAGTKVIASKSENFSGPRVFIDYCYSMNTDFSGQAVDAKKRSVIDTHIRSSGFMNLFSD